MCYTYLTTKLSFDAHPESDVFWTTADCGWITGHSYVVYGPLLNGLTGIIFEGVPNWPDVGRFWSIIQKYQVSKFYTAPTAVRSLMGHSEQFVRTHDRSSLKVDERDRFLVF
jgi:acetyl-CoA synthetase